MGDGNLAALITLAGMAGAAVDRLLQAVLGYWRDRNKGQLDEHQEIVGQYRALVKRQQVENDRLAADLNASRQQHTDCLLANEQLRSELRVLRGEMNQLRFAQAAGRDPAWAEATVLCDDAGAVLEWNRAAQGLLGYTREEAVGAHVALIMAAPGRDAFQRGWDAWKAERRPPTGRMLSVTALSKGGVEMPLEVLLSGWQAGGRWYCCASLRRRFEKPEEKKP